MKGLFMTATDTDVGKTWIGTQIVTELLGQNIPVKARKPIESGWPCAEKVKDTDAWKLTMAAQQQESIDIVCPNRFSAAISPDRAAMLEGEQLLLEKLREDCLKSTDETDFLYVEGAGGFYSPLCHDGLNADLASSLGLDVILIVENRLGCINQTLLNVAAIHQRGLKLKAIALNNPKQTNNNNNEMDNLEDIQKRVNCKVVPFEFQQKSDNSIKLLVREILKDS